MKRWEKDNPLVGKTICFFLLFSLILIPAGQSLASFPKTGEKPRIVIRLVVEEMRYEMLLRYWDQFSEDGFKKLINEGVVFKNARINYSNVSHSSGFSTIATGTYPSMHGIISDNWHDRLTGKKIYCIGDQRYKGLGGESQNGEFSPANLLATTTGDELKLLNGKSKVLSIGLNPLSSVLGVGKMADAAYWFDNKTGNWMSNSFYMDSLPKWVKRFNAQNLEDVYMDRHWKTFLPDSNYISARNDRNEDEEGFLLLYRKEFPYNLKVLKDKSHSFKYLKYTPYGNTYTSDFAVSLILNEQLGKDDHTDILNLSFSASAYVNELFGPHSMEMEDLYVRLDQEISHLLNFLEDHFSKNQVMVVFTSNRGCVDRYEYRKKRNLQTSKFNFNQGIALLNAYLGVIFEQDQWISGYTSKQIYLDHALIDRNGYSVADFQDKIARFMVKKAGIANAVKASTIRNNHFSEGLLSKIQNSYHPERSGDVLLVYEPGTVEVPYSTGSVYNYDNHVPMVWWGDDFSPNVINEEVNLRDIAPTLSHILNIPFPDASSGKLLVPFLYKGQKKHF